MTKVKDFKSIINAVPDDYLFLIKDEKGATYFTKLEVNTDTKAIMISKL